MTKSVRTLLFALFVALFLLIAPLVIGYSQGYRLDWQNKTIVQTGGLFLEPRPAPVEIYLNQKLAKKSSFVFQNVFLGNLIPKNYRLRIEKDNYYAWEKNLDISPKLVTAAKNITLFPELGREAENVIGSKLRDFSASPSGKYFAFINNDSTPRITLYSISAQKVTLTFDAPATFSDYKIENIQWNKDSTRFMFLLKSDASWKWVSVDPKAGALSSIDISSDISSSGDFRKYTKELYKPVISKIKWSLVDSDKLFFVAHDRDKKYLLFSYNIASKKISPPLAYDVLEYSPEKNAVFYVSSMLGNINRLDTNTKEIHQVSFSNIFGKEKNAPTTFISHAQEQYLILKIADALYYFDKKTGLMQKISDGVESAVVTTDGKKILLVGENTLSVYWLEDAQIQPFRDAGDLEIIYTSAGAINDAVWFSKNNAYVLFADQDTIKVVELDGRDKRNIHILTEKPSNKLFYEKDKEILYFLSDETIYSLSLK